MFNREGVFKMPMTIATNVASINAQRQLADTQNSLSTSMQRLSSGLRVNSARDDAAGLAIAERMEAQMRGMNVAVRNGNDAISLSQTAEGALGKIGESLQRMRELAVQSANATNTTGDRTNLDTEYKQLASEVNRVLQATTFNSVSLLDGNATLSFQVGADNATNNQVSITTTKLATGTGVTAALNGTINAVTSATKAISDLDTAINEITTARASFGAAQSRFESIVSQLQVAAETQAASRGRIMDADFAVETANLSRAQILQQAGSAMVAQANQAPQQVLSLLRGL
jgi:flagellin